MERYCGDLSASVSNHRRPYSNISKRIFAKGMLAHIGIKYGIKDALSLEKWKLVMDLQRKPKRSLPIVSFVIENTVSWLISGYTDLNYTLPLPGPKPTTHQQVSAHTFNLIIGTLATIWNFPPEHSLRDLVTFNKISVYGHVRVLGGGDSI